MAFQVNKNQYKGAFMLLFLTYSSLYGIMSTLKHRKGWRQHLNILFIFSQTFSIFLVDFFPNGAYYIRVTNVTELTYPMR